jgi:hypothetical protein
MSKAENGVIELDCAQEKQLLQRIRGTGIFAAPDTQDGRNYYRNFLADCLRICGDYKRSKIEGPVELVEDAAPD